MATIEAIKRSPEAGIVLQNAVTTGNGSAWNLHASVSAITLYLQWSAGCSAGVITVETASDPDDAGTWAPLWVENWDAAGKQTVVQINGALMAVRARVSTDIVGGTVTVTGCAVKAGNS